MNITLTEQDVRTLTAHARTQLDTSHGLYMMFRARFPQITHDSIRLMQERIYRNQGSPEYSDDETPVAIAAIYENSAGLVQQITRELDDGLGHAASICGLQLFLVTQTRTLAALEVLASGGRPGRAWLDEALAAQRTRQATLAANSRHGQVGGYRAKKQRLLAEWATGKYKSRAECAQKLHQSLGLSLETARKALRNTPNQT